MTDDEETRNMWNYKFELLYDVIVLKNTIKTKITITNTGNMIKEIFDVKIFVNIKFCVNHKGEVDFDFTCLMHTYFKVDDINNVVVHNLEGLEYIDKVLIFKNI